MLRGGLTACFQSTSSGAPLPPTVLQCLSPQSIMTDPRSHQAWPFPPRPFRNLTTLRVVSLSQELINHLMRSGISSVQWLSSRTLQIQIKIALFLNIFSVFPNLFLLILRSRKLNLLFFLIVLFPYFYLSIKTVQNPLLQFLNIEFQY